MLEPIEPQIYSVTQFNQTVNEMLSHFEVLIKGEVSDFKISHNRWVTFDLKDDGSKLGCFMTAYQLTVQIQDGMEIIAKGRAGVYVPYGKYSFKPTYLEPIGEGALQKAFELTKQKLAQEGLFEEQYKKTIPRFPRTIGLITSEQAAAYTDFLRILNNRWGGVTVSVFPVHVQGCTASGEIVDAIEYFNRSFPVDVLVLTRGGGSLEDLQAFNAESVCRSIFASNIPIICGVGHERDTTLAELVADCRASTPSNAAEIAVPAKEEIFALLESYADKMELLLQRNISANEEILTRYIRYFDQYIQDFIQKTEQMIRRLQMHFAMFMTHISTMDAHITLLNEKLNNLFEMNITAYAEQITRLSSLLHSMNPQAILRRGYSITHIDGKLMRHVADARLGDTLRTYVCDGYVDSVTVTRHSGKLKKEKKTILKKSDSQQAFL